MNVIFAVGGSGQLILHHYQVLYLAGIIKQPFRAYVIDTDKMLPSLRYLSKFYERTAKFLRNFDLGGLEIPVLDSINCGTDQGATISEVLTGEPLSASPAYRNVANAFFSRDCLAQTTVEGLYARPALSSVTVASALLRQIRSEMVDQGSRILVVGSLIGGTGGGLIVPLLSRLQDLCEEKDGARIYATLLGEYFTPDSNKVLNAQRRFRSNWLLLKRSLEESVPQLWGYALIDKARLSKRDTEEEKRSKHLLLPDDETNPYWQALVSSHHLLEETTRDKAVDFTNRRLQWDTARAALTQAQAETMIENALGFLFILRKRDAFRRLLSDPWARVVWKRFGDFGADILKLHLEAKTVDANAWRFFSIIQAELNNKGRIEEDGDVFELDWVFPKLSPSRISPHNFRCIAWPQAEKGSRSAEFVNIDESARAVAAGTAFLALHLGGRRI